MGVPESGNAEVLVRLGKISMADNRSPLSFFSCTLVRPDSGLLKAMLFLLYHTSLSDGVLVLE